MLKQRSARFLLTFMIILWVSFASGCQALQSPEPVPKPDVGQEDKSDLPHHTINVKEHTLDPAEVTVRAGQKIRLIFHNIGTMDHELAVLDMPANVEQIEQESENDGSSNLGPDQRQDPGNETVKILVQPREHGEALLTPTQPGRYDVICTIADHDEQGERASIIVQ